MCWINFSATGGEPGRGRGGGGLGMIHHPSALRQPSDIRGSPTFSVRSWDSHVHYQVYYGHQHFARLCSISRVHQLLQKLSLLIYRKVFLEDKKKPLGNNFCLQCHFIQGGRKKSNIRETK